LCVLLLERSTTSNGAAIVNIAHTTPCAGPWVRGAASGPAASQPSTLCHATITKIRINCVSVRTLPSHELHKAFPSIHPPLQPRQPCPSCWVASGSIQPRLCH
jgi:hypothetical protein